MTNEHEEISPFSMKAIYDRYKRSHSGAKNNQPYQPAQAMNTPRVLMPETHPTTSPVNEHPPFSESQYQIPAIPQSKRTHLSSAPTIPKNPNQEDLFFNSIYNKILDGKSSQSKTKPSKQEKTEKKKHKVSEELVDQSQPKSFTEKQRFEILQDQPRSFRTSSTTRPDDDYYDVPVRGSIPGYPSSSNSSTLEPIATKETKSLKESKHQNSSSLGPIPQSQLFATAPSAAHHRHLDSKSANGRKESEFQTHNHRQGSKLKVNNGAASTSKSVAFSDSKPRKSDGFLLPSEVITAQQAASRSANRNFNNAHQANRPAEVTPFPPTLIPGSPSVASSHSSAYSESVSEPSHRSPSAHYSYSNHAESNKLSSALDIGVHNEDSGNSILIPIRDMPLRDIQPYFYDGKGPVNDDIVDRSVVGTPIPYGTLGISNGQTSAAAMAAAMGHQNQSPNPAMSPSKSKWRNFLRSSPSNPSRNSQPLSKNDITGPPSIPYMPSPSQRSPSYNQAMGSGSYNPSRNGSRSILSQPTNRSTLSQGRRSFSGNSTRSPNPNHMSTPAFDKIRHQFKSILPYILPVVNFIRYIAKSSIILAPIDRIADNVPALLPSVVILEALLLLWIIHQLALIIETFMQLVQIICAPVLSIAKIFGIGGNSNANATPTSNTNNNYYNPNANSRGYDRGYSNNEGGVIQGVNQIGYGMANAAGGIVKNVVQGAAHGVEDMVGAVDGIGRAALAPNQHEYRNNQYNNNGNRRANWY